MGLSVGRDIDAGVHYPEREMAGGRRTRILLVEGEGIMQEGLRALLDAQPDLETVEDDHRAGATCESVGGPPPDIILANIVTLGPASIGIIHQIRREYPNAKMIVLVALSNRFFLGELLRAGVRGYVTVQNTFDELLEAIRTVASSLTYLCPNVRGQIIADYARVGVDHRSACEAGLTERERTILRFLGDGKTSKQVAQAENLSSKTIDACRRQLMRKLNVDSAAGLVKCAVLMGMTAAAPWPASTR